MDSLLDMQLRTLFMKIIETQIDIKASIADVWNLFADFEGYSKWNPFLIEAKGSLVEGSVMKITARFANGNVRTATPVVDKVVLGKSACFIAKKSFLFTGRHYFIFEPISIGHTRFIHGEYFSGLLPLLFWNKIERSLTVSFIEMNKALKLQAEKKFITRRDGT